MHIARKRFGQNFLQDRSIIDRLCDAIDPKPGEQLLEIGPGMGALTRPLLMRAHKLTCVEIDRDLSAALENRLQGTPQLDNLEIINQDILKFDPKLLSPLSHGLRVVGNLPYNISTPVLFHLMKYKALIADMHVMLQKEVVTRLQAGPNDSQYGRLSVMVQYHCQVHALFDIPPTAFKPRPKVMSAFVCLRPHRTQALKALDETLLAAIVQTAFNQRRKMLSNTLRTYLSSDELTALNLDPQARAQALSVEDFVRIANFCQARSSNLRAQ